MTATPKSEVRNLKSEAFRLPASGFSLLVFLFFFLVSDFGFQASGYAACSSPAGNAGVIINNSDYHVLQYCDGTNWIAMGPHGAGGAGCTSPAGVEGDIIYNGDYHVMQFCDGTNWQPMGPTGSGTPTSGLVGWWKLDDASGCTSAADSSGNGYTAWGTGTLVCGVAGKINQAMTFDGATNYLSPTEVAGQRIAGSWTVSGWVNPAALPPSNVYMKIIDKSDGSASVCTNYLIGIDNGHKCAGGLSFRAAFETSGVNCPVSVDACYTTTINTGTWYHVAGVYDSSAHTLTLYVNGVAVQTTATGANVPATGNGAIFFGTTDGASGFLNGTIDDVRVYNRALSAAEITALASCGEGTMFYNSASSVMQYCNGAGWVGIGK